MVGVSTRAVRYYHRCGLIPEPERTANGYRTYGIRDAVTLARIKRLTELGLSLDEVRDVLADDQGRELREVLAELDADLARQEEQIRRRRARLANLLEQETLHPDDPVSPEMATVVGRLPRTRAGMADVDRSWLGLLDVSLPEPDRRELIELMRAMGADSETAARADELYPAMDELATADVDDPRVAELANQLVIGVLQPVLDMLADAPGGDVAPDGIAPEFEEFLAELAPAQAEVIRRALAQVARKQA